MEQWHEHMNGESSSEQLFALDSAKTHNQTYSAHTRTYATQQQTDDCIFSFRFSFSSSSPVFLLLYCSRSVMVLALPCFALPFQRLFFVDWYQVIVLSIAFPTSFIIFSCWLPAAMPLIVFPKPKSISIHIHDIFSRVVFFSLSRKSVNLRKLENFLRNYQLTWMITTMCLWLCCCVNS